MSDYDVIREVYNDLMKERRNYKKELADKTEKIKKIDSYLNSLFNKEDNDTQVFLARKIESLYRDEIQRNKQEREKLAIESEHLEEYINALSIKINKLKKVLSEHSTMLHVKQLESDSMMNILEGVVKRIESVSLYADKDSDRTKDGLDDIKMDIYKVIDILKKIDK